MGAAELKPAVIRAALGVLGLTALGAVAGVLAPGLGGHTPPHPTLTGSASDALSILSNNARLLCVPFLLAGVRFADSRPGRVIGDAAVIVLAGLSAATVGIALGRWRGRLIPYLPHLPLEWAALTAALAAWLLVRTGHAPARRLVALGAVTFVLLCAAVAVETWATPHRSEQTHRCGIADARGRGRASRLMRPRDYAGAATSPRHALCFSGRRGTSAPAIAGALINHRPSRRDHRMNTVQITGNLTQRPEQRETRSETTVARMRIAVPRPRKNGEDQGADFVDVTVFGTQADNCLRYLTKGRKIAVEGRLHHSEWDSDTGRRQKLEVIARFVEFLGTPAKTTDSTTPPEPIAVPAGVNTGKDEDDIPF